MKAQKILLSICISVIAHFIIIFFAFSQSKNKKKYNLYISKISNKKKDEKITLIVNSSVVNNIKKITYKKTFYKSFVITESGDNKNTEVPKDKKRVFFESNKNSISKNSQDLKSDKINKKNMKKSKNIFPILENSNQNIDASISEKEYVSKAKKNEVKSAFISKKKIKSNIKSLKKQLYSDFKNKGSINKTKNTYKVNANSKIPLIDSFETEKESDYNFDPKINTIQTDLGKYKYSVKNAISKKWNNYKNTQQFQTGTVKVNCLVNSEGEILNLKIIQSSKDDELFKLIVKVFKEANIPIMKENIVSQLNGMPLAIKYDIIID